MPKRGIDNLPIVDARQPITLTITKDDINRSDRKKPSNCAIAVACRRGLGAIEVRIHLSRAYIRSNKGNFQRYEVPKGLRTEMVAFDRGGDFTPGSWVLTPPRPSRLLTGRRTGGSSAASDKRKYKKSGKPRAKYHVLSEVRDGPF